MPDAEGTLVDGDNTFNLGMDSSRESWRIAKSQYARACNVFIPRTGGGLVNRFGFSHQFLEFGKNEWARDVYEKGNIEGEGSFYDGKQNILLASVDGYIFQFTRTCANVFDVVILNQYDRNKPRPKVWFTRVPNGAILNDGLACPTIITKDHARRVAGKDAINPGREGVYVQNRFFYVTPDRKRIIASDFRSPTSLANARSTNIWGWVVPDDSENITAIGKQKVMIDYVEGGALVFSTENNVYSVDVRGDRQAWGNIESSGLGAVTETIPGIGATSSYSFESFNTNLYFRSKHYGLVDLRQSQDQFVNENDFEMQSIEASYWFDRDTEAALDVCYTARYKNRLFTTVAPEVNKNGMVFWNGMISVHPSPAFVNNEKFPRRYESLITGIRPVVITTTVQPGSETNMFIHSHDIDGKNRLYQVDDRADFDINHKGERVEIESWIESRGYTFDYAEEPKRIISRYYGLRDLSRDTSVRIRTRIEDDGPWQEVSDLTHKVPPTFSGQFLEPNCYRKHQRNRVFFCEEPDNSCETPGNIGGGIFYSRQYRFDIRGPFRLNKLILKSYPETQDKDPLSQQDEMDLDFPNIYDLPRDYTYNIADHVNIPKNV